MSNWARGAKKKFIVSVASGPVCSMRRFLSVEIFSASAFFPFDPSSCDHRRLDETKINLIRCQKCCKNAIKLDSRCNLENVHMPLVGTRSQKGAQNEDGRDLKDQKESEVWAHKTVARASVFCVIAYHRAFSSPPRDLHKSERAVTKWVKWKTSRLHTSWDVIAASNLSLFPLHHCAFWVLCSQLNRIINIHSLRRSGNFSPFEAYQFTQSQLRVLWKWDFHHLNNDNVFVIIKWLPDIKIKIPKLRFSRLAEPSSILYTASTNSKRPCIPLPLAMHTVDFFHYALPPHFSYRQSVNAVWNPW